MTYKKAITIDFCQKRIKEIETRNKEINKFLQKSNDLPLAIFETLEEAIEGNEEGILIWKGQLKAIQEKGGNKSSIHGYYQEN